MRVKRVVTNKRNRHRKAKNIIFFALIIPCLAIFMGYLIASMVVFPKIK